MVEFGAGNRTGCGRDLVGLVVAAPATTFNVTTQIGPSHQLPMLAVSSRGLSIDRRWNGALIQPSIAHAGEGGGTGPGHCATSLELAARAPAAVYHRFAGSS